MGIDPYNLEARPRPETVTDSNLVHKMRLELDHVIKTSGEVADLVSLGDTDHNRNQKILERLASPEYLTAMAEAGMTHLFVEMPQNFNLYYKALHDGKIDKDRFCEAIKDEGYRSLHGNTDSVLRQQADLITAAARYGIAVHAADPMNGVVFDHDGAHVDMNRRLHDEQLAEFVSKTLNGEKGMIFYGGAHGAQYGDFEEFMPGLTHARINVYHSDEQRQKTERTFEQINNVAATRIGEDQPDVIVVLNNGMFSNPPDAVYTTNATPAPLIEKLVEQASDVRLYYSEEDVKRFGPQGEQNAKLDVFATAGQESQSDPQTTAPAESMPLAMPKP